MQHRLVLWEMLPVVQVVEVVARILYYLVTPGYRAVARIMPR